MGEPGRSERPDTGAVPDDLEVAGLAGERTDLAWSRTGLAATAAGVTLLQRIFQAVDSVTARVAVFSILATGAGVWLATLWWAHAMRTSFEGRAVAGRRHLRTLTVGTTAFCLAALVVALLPR